MKSKTVSRSPGNSRLILIFAGWGMDWRPFRELRVDGYDITVIWDYRSLTFNWTPLLQYDEICLLAWSMGVFAASLTVHELLPRLTKRIAVNGTLTPVDDRRGIPEAIFDGTLAGMSPQNLRKFYRRMCTTAAEFEAFQAHRPQRKLEELIDELQAIATYAIFHTQQVEEWDLAVIARNDRIFPAANQLNAWRGKTPVQLMQSGHLPDFQMLLSRLFIDKSLVSRRFGASQATYGRHAVVQKRISQRLYSELLRYAGNTDGTVIEVGAGHGFLTGLYAPAHKGGPVMLWDIAAVGPDLDGMGTDIRTEICDAEIRIRRQPSESAAFILSASTIQWFNSPSGFLRECERVLAPGGWLAISTFVQGNLPELAELCGTGLQLPTADAWRTMIPPELEVLVRTSGEERLSFDSPREVLEHLRLTGVNAVDYGRSPMVLARRILENFPRDEQGRCTLTFRPIYIIARKAEI